MTLPVISPRQRLAAALRDNRLLIAAELLLIVLIQWLQASGRISAAVVYLFLLGWLSVWLRGRGWRSLGLRRPASWPRTVALGAGVGLAYQLVSIGLIVPLLQRLTNAPLDVSQFAALRGNAPALLGALALAWLIGAFAEELVYRGFVLNRFADLAGPRPAGWARGLLGSAALFGWGHLYQGPSGVAETFLFGCAMAAVYLATQSNLWAAILAHGVNNTIGLFLIYLGLYP